MNILHVINNFTYTSIPVEMANLMSSKNDVSIIALYDTQEKAEGIAKDIAKNCKVYGLNFRKNKLKSIKLLKRIITNDKFDIIHTHHALSGAIVRYIIRNKNNPKIVHTVHANHNSFNFKQNFIIGNTLKYSDVIVFNSNSTRNGILSWQNKKIKKCRKEIIYNGIDTKRILNISDEYANDFIKKYNIKDDTYVFAQVGRLEDVKNPLGTLLAFKMLLENNPDITSNVLFVYMGDGSQRSKMEDILANSDILSKHVILAGMLKREQVYSLMKRVDALVVPSFYEGFCNALFEGMTCGNQLLISDIPVFEELVEDSQYVNRFNPNSKEDICEKLKQAIHNKLTYEGKQHLKNIAINCYDMDICINKYLNLYKDII